MGRHSRPDPPPSRRPPEPQPSETTSPTRPRHLSNNAPPRASLPPTRGPIPPPSARPPRPAAPPPPRPGPRHNDVEQTRPNPAVEDAEPEEEPPIVAALNGPAWRHDRDSDDDSDSGPPPRPADLKELTDTGYHRAVGRARRGFAKGPLAIAAAVLLLALGTFGVVWANKALNAQAQAEANSCTEGTRNLLIATTPDIETEIQAAADRWNSKARSVSSYCVTVKITPASPEEILPALQSATGGNVPAVWITPDAGWAEKLAATNPERVSSTSIPLEDADGTFYPYVVIGGPGVDEVQQGAAQEFRDYALAEVAK